MEKVRTRELYSSSNGDRWHLCRSTSGKVFVLHQANIPAGGRISQIELDDFLAKGHGPEQQALVQMIGSLVEPAPDNPGELLTGEGDPGPALSGWQRPCVEVINFARDGERNPKRLRQSVLISHSQPERHPNCKDVRVRSPRRKKWGGSPKP
jgi:hypothetical protein